MISILFNICLVQSPFSMAQAGDLHASDTVAWQAFGSAVSGAGDVNGDGFDDVLVGAYGDNNSMGALYLFFGSASGVVAASEHKLVSPQGAVNDNFGRAVAGGGDLNGDGFDDVAGGAYLVDGAGSVVLFAGAASGPFEARRLIEEPREVSHLFGTAISLAGDLDGDGLDDLVVGCPGDGEAATNAGAVHIFSGQADLNTLSEETVLASDALPNDLFGEAVATGGDLNGDGYGDLAVGASGVDFNGVAVYTYLGSATGIDRASEHRIEPAAGALDGFGNQVSISGDLDGDGYDDLVTGATYPWDYDDVAGKTFVFFGDSDGIDEASELALTASDGYSGDGFGRWTAITNDSNGDGLDDLAVGAWYIDAALGAVYLYPGGEDRLSDPPERKLSADDDPDYYDWYGYAVADAGDLDADGTADLVIGAPGNNAEGESSGTVYLVYGCVDIDFDGICSDTDCDDQDATVDDTLLTLAVDGDGDGYGHPLSADLLCPGTEGFSQDASDCDDEDASTYPGAAELESDSDCMTDSDGDGYGDIDVPKKSDLPIVAGIDCDDDDLAIHPGAAEGFGDEVDSNCDGDEYCYSDLDNDSYSDGRAQISEDLFCSDVGETTDDLLGDCDDSDNAVYPGAIDPCGDGVDSDCDGVGGPNGDEDEDGLTWSQEDRLGTSDCDEDSDDDGLTDNEEYELGTNPSLADTDGDGLLDGEDDDPLVPADQRSCGCSTGSGPAGALGLALLLFMALIGTRRHPDQRSGWLSLLVLLPLGAASIAQAEPFPLGWFDALHNPDDPTLIGGHGDANTVIAYWAYSTVEGRQAYLDNALAAGIDVIIATEDIDASSEVDVQGILDIVNAYDDHPAVSGWYTADEPWYAWGIQYEKLQLAYDTIKSVSDKPVHITFTEYAMYEASPSIPVQYKDAYDIFHIDVYPSRIGEPEFSRLEYEGRGKDFKNDMVRTHQEAIKADRPWWAVLSGWGSELGDGSDYRLPTAAETRFASFWSLSEEPSGVLHFAYYRTGTGLVPARPDEPYPYDGETWLVDVYEPHLEELSTLGPALQMGKLSDAVSVNRPDIRAAIYQDPDTSTLYLVALNSTTGSETVTFDLLLELTDNITAIPRFEGDKSALPIVKGKFTDSFTQYQVHIYELACGDYDQDGAADVDCGGDDCDDSDPTVGPAAEESWYDGIDQDCAGDDDFDADGDGWAWGGGDCDDTNAAVHPGAVEVWYDGIDSDCNLDSDFDADGDGYDAADFSGGDCDDDDPQIHPEAFEVWYDGVDSDCLGDSDYDADWDGYDATAHGGTDCDDQNIQVHPGAPEVVGNGIDEDCQDGDRALESGTMGCGCLTSGGGMGWPGILVMAWVVWGRGGRKRMLMFPVLSVSSSRHPQSGNNRL